MIKTGSTVNPRKHLFYSSLCNSIKFSGFVKNYAVKCCIFYFNVDFSDGYFKASSYYSVLDNFSVYAQIMKNILIHGKILDTNLILNFAVYASFFSFINVPVQVYTCKVIRSSIRFLITCN